MAHAVDGFHRLDDRTVDAGRDRDLAGLLEIPVRRRIEAAVDGDGLTAQEHIAVGANVAAANQQVLLGDHRHIALAADDGAACTAGRFAVLGQRAAGLANAGGCAADFVAQVPDAFAAVAAGVVARRRAGVDDNRPPIGSKPHVLDGVDGRSGNADVAIAAVHVDGVAGNQRCRLPGACGRFAGGGSLGAEGERLDAAGVGAAVDGAAHVAQAHAADRDAGAFAVVLAGFAVLVLRTRHHDVAFRIEHHAALGAQVGTDQGNVAVNRAAGRVPGAAARGADENVAGCAQVRATADLAERISRTAALAAAEIKRHARRGDAAVGQFLDLGLCRTGVGQVLEGVCGRADQLHAKTALLIGVVAVRCLRIAAGQDGDVLRLNVDVAGPAGHIARRLAGDDVAAHDAGIAARGQDDVAAGRAEQAARVALRGAVHALVGLAVAAPIGDAHAARGEAAFLFPAVVVFGVGVHARLHGQVAFGVQHDVFGSHDLRARHADVAPTADQHAFTGQLGALGGGGRTAVLGVRGPAG
ncbi:hypothetical protein LMG3412_06482 [Achromobacter deleyi]|nr:hypothetical protein LMG3412_06482 [Achromobacter deleyi]